MKKKIKGSLIMSLFFYGFLALFFISCRAKTNSLEIPSSLTLTNTPSPTQITHRESVVSPNGNIYGEIICYQRTMTESCVTRYKNGNILAETPGEWSPDGKYAAQCFGDTYSTSCVGLTIWDMEHGIVKSQFYIYNLPHLFKWSPSSDHSLMYFVNHGITNMPDAVIEIDPEKGDWTVLSDCPEWFFRNTSFFCVSQTGVNIGGKVLNNTKDLQITIEISSSDKKTRAYQTGSTGNFEWRALIDISKNSDFQVTITTNGNNKPTIDPSSYTISVFNGLVFFNNKDEKRVVNSNSLDFTLQPK